MSLPTAEELRAIQRPLKQAYREDPGRALVTSTVTARLAEDGIASSVDTTAGEVRAGLHPVAGGDGSEACSADILLEALAACAGVTLRSVATAMGVTLRSGAVHATGTWDARGTLGVDRTTPVGLTNVRLELDLDTDADEATTAQLVTLTERYCVIAQTLASPPSFEWVSGRSDILTGVTELRVPSGPGIPDGLVIPGPELDERFSRASGPGGQGVNTTDSRVQLSLDIAATTALTPRQRTRALERLGPRLVGTVLTVDAAEHRSQRRNRAAARERIASLLREALAPPPPPRRATRPTKGSQRRRLEAKTRRAAIKRHRSRPSSGD